MRASSGSLGKLSKTGGVSCRLGGRRWVTPVTKAPGLTRAAGEEVWKRMMLLDVVAMIPPGRRIAITACSSSDGSPGCGVAQISEKVTRFRRKHQHKLLPMVQSDCAVPNCDCPPYRIILPSLNRVTLQGPLDRYILRGRCTASCCTTCRISIIASHRRPPRRAVRPPNALKTAIIQILTHIIHRQILDRHDIL
jgi:hypothetical protein